MLWVVSHKDAKILANTVMLNLVQHLTSDPSKVRP